MMIPEVVNMMKAGSEIWSRELSDAFVAIESSARSEGARALISANRFLASRTLRLLGSGLVKSRIGEADLFEDAGVDLVWLDIGEEGRGPETSAECGHLRFREILSLACPVERTVVAFLPSKGSVACIVTPPAPVVWSSSAQHMTSSADLRFRVLRLDIDPENDAQLLPESAKGVFYQIASERWLLFSALIIGVAQAAFSYVLNYCLKRTAFGKAIGHHQAVALKLADIAIALESSRLLCLDLCASGHSDIQLFQQAEHIWNYVKSIPTETAPQIMQAMGGHGYLDQHPVQRWFCDLQVLSLAGELPDSLVTSASHD